MTTKLDSQQIGHLGIFNPRSIIIWSGRVLETVPSFGPSALEAIPSWTGPVGVVFSAVCFCGRFSHLVFAIPGGLCLEEKPWFAP